MNVQLLMLRAALPSSRMPPPDVASPSVMVSPEMATLALPLTSKTRLASLPLTESVFAPGPSIVTLWLIGNSPLVSLMVPCSPGANTMVASPERMPARSEPAPLSARLVTGKVLSRLLLSSPSRRGRTARRARAGLDLGRRDRVEEPVDNRRTQDAIIIVAAFSREKEREPIRKKKAHPGWRIHGQGWLDRSLSMLMDCRGVPLGRPSAMSSQGG